MRFASILRILICSILIMQWAGAKSSMLIASVFYDSESMFRLVGLVGFGFRGLGFRIALVCAGFVVRFYCFIAITIYIVL